MLACDIDKDCRDVYERNYQMRPLEDVKAIDTETMPDFDVLCAGFPCQAFSHAGRQEGFADIRGTLFMEIVRILRAKKPSYFLLENVKNLKGHDSGNTWRTIYRHLVDAGYQVTETPILLSPHDYGIPQHRERVYILGVRADVPTPLQPFVRPVAPGCSIRTILEETPTEPGLALAASDSEVLDLWEDFVQQFKARNQTLPSFPIWTDEWDTTDDITHHPGWKQAFIRKNRDFYAAHRDICEPWLVRARQSPAFIGTRRKFEWQCGAFQADDSLWTLMFQYRPSGIRVKRPTYAPTLVAMAQIPVLGWLRRKLSPREIARLQSFPDTFQLPARATTAYKQFGNSVNVTVVRHVAEHLLYAWVGT